MLIEIKDRTKTLITELVAVWDASVKATHTFLGEKDVIALRPFVETGLEEIDKLVVAYDNHKAVGFMGIAQGKVEMLFLEPTYIGKGIGKNLMLKAIDEYTVSYVDVNEQNPHAVVFYKSFGFEVFERTEVDEQGNPFPILKLRRNTKMCH
ncbi:GNAT family N-acetyltransferase [Anaerosporobacter sp.]|uniref:GNAT family N-acetyltransferase n=1 Tax=Anaerosporobacter sp. TaxID=1872529 RepID=UPI00286F98A4|nr:GNAT family N-acetyltransferase [Anaerosporobacter sp.]